MEEPSGTSVSLALLQNRIKRDPAGYRTDFDGQWDHFLSLIGLLQLQPHKPMKEFGELAMFLAQTSYSYDEEVTSRFIEQCKTLLKDPLVSQLHRVNRRMTVYALRLLNNRGRFPSLEAMPVWFDTFAMKDKELRHELMTHIVRDVIRISRKDRTQAIQALMQKFLLAQMSLEDKSRRRRAAAILMELYRRRVWVHPGLVNALALACLHPDVKLGAACANFLLGNKISALEENDDDEEDLDKLVSQTRRGVVGAKKTAGRMKKLEREKAKVAKKVANVKPKASGLDGTASVAAIDAIYDAESLCSKLLKRIRSKHGTFNFRLTLFSLTSRLISAHKLPCFDFYGLIQSFLRPKQGQVTHLLAAFAQATHSLIPPSELKAGIDIIASSFTSDDQAPEVICVGLNTLREVVLRNEVALSADIVAHLMEFVRHKNKGVVAGARGLMNVLRELNPALLPKDFRGRASSMAIQQGSETLREFGQQNFVTAVPGIEFLAKAKLLRVARRETKPATRNDESLEALGNDEDDNGSTVAENAAGSSGSESESLDCESGSEDTDQSDNCENESSENENSENENSENESSDSEEVSGQNVDEEHSDDDEEAVEAGDTHGLEDCDKGLAKVEPLNKYTRKRNFQESVASDKSLAEEWSTNYILSQEDFRRIKRLRVAMATSNDRRKHEEAFELSNEESSSDSDESKEDEGVNQFVTSDSITTKFKSNSKAGRMATIKQGRDTKTTVVAQKRADQKMEAAGKPKPNSVKKRAGPIMMQVHSRRVKQKVVQDFRSKAVGIRNHIRNLKKKTGEKKRWRKA